MVSHWKTPKKSLKGVLRRRRPSSLHEISGGALDFRGVERGGKDSGTCGRHEQGWLCVPDQTGPAIAESQWRRAEQNLRWQKRAESQMGSDTF